MELAAVQPVKFKRRVSAVRDFPKGCGRRRPAIAAAQLKDEAPLGYDLPNGMNLNLPSPTPPGEEVAPISNLPDQEKRVGMLDVKMEPESVSLLEVTIPGHEETLNKATPKSLGSPPPEANGSAEGLSEMLVKLERPKELSDQSESQMKIPCQPELPKKGACQLELVKENSHQFELSKEDLDQLALPKGGSDQRESAKGSSVQLQLGKGPPNQLDLSNCASYQLDFLQESRGPLELLKKISDPWELPKRSLDQAEQLRAATTSNLNINCCYSKSYPPPKRRRVSALRTYPVGCGRRASQLINKGSFEVAASTPVKCSSLDVREEHPANRQLAVEGSAEVKHTETGTEEAAKVDSKQTCEVLHDNVSEVRVNFPYASLKCKSPSGEKKHILKQPAQPELSTRVVPTEISHGEARRNDVKQIMEMSQEIPSEARVNPSSKSCQLAVEGSAEVRHTGTETEEAAEVDSKQTCEVLHDNVSEVRVKFPYASLKCKSPSGEKKHVLKQLAQSELSAGVVPSEISHGEARRNDVKQIMEMSQEIPNEARVNPSSKSCPHGSIMEACHKTEILVKSDSEKKFKEHDAKKLSKSLLIKACESMESPDSRSQSGNKFRIKLGTTKVGKPYVKELVKHPADGKSVKRKFKEETWNEGLTTTDQTEGVSLEANSAKSVVQSMQSSPNKSLWQRGKSGEVTQRSVKTIKNKRKSGIKKSAFKGTSVSRLKGEEGEENDVALDEANKQALTVYKNPRELTVIPLVPPRTHHGGSDNEAVSDRYKVKRALRLFQLLCRKFLQEQESRPKDLGRLKRVDLRASEILKDKGEYVNKGDKGDAIIGHVPGVEVGDEFQYRVELSIVGLHRPFQAGIDFTGKKGKQLAASIVASGGYQDDMDSSDLLIYSGSGGNPASGGKQAEDQKLERGNLSLKNCIDTRSPVRVIRGFKELKGSDRDVRAKAVSTLTYDGLYIVERHWKEIGPYGFSVFKFQLRRMAGQPELALKEVKRSKKAKIREGLCKMDISEGKENLPISAVNTIDDDRPMPFKYVTRNIYPSWYVHTRPSGCGCTNGCSDSESCACAIKNGGEIPYNYNGAIIQARTLVIECGPSCKCPPSCYNRVSQNGIQIPLEIFKTKSRGWGVRSLNSIPSGSFICEYIGEVLKDSDAEVRSNDEYLFDIGHNYEDKALWEGLPSFIPSLQSNSISKTMEDTGFTIDAAEYGNIGRFINHSCSPNLYAQNVLYDEEDERMPHIMFFAADNIPPLQELTYDYNYARDQVRDSEGNIKRKNCHCGSPDCTGRLY